MSDPRLGGILALGFSILAFAGSSSGVLPGELFRVGLLAAPVGVFLFVKGSRQAIAQAELAAERALARDARGAAPAEVQERVTREEQIDKLSRLREEGIISEQEFATAKAKLLA